MELSRTPPVRRARRCERGKGGGWDQGWGGDDAAGSGVSAGSGLSEGGREEGCLCLITLTNTPDSSNENIFQLFQMNHVRLIHQAVVKCRFIKCDSADRHLENKQDKKQQDTVARSQQGRCSTANKPHFHSKLKL